MNDTATASPRPWRVRMETRDIYERRGTFAHVEDANGETICTTITPRCDADAALIVEAVNERERLRDIVRRLADLAGNLLANYEYRYSDDHNSMEFVERTRGFIAEARAAIGEGEACE